MGMCWCDEDYPEKEIKVTDPVKNREQRCGACTINKLASVCRNEAAKWWVDPKTQVPIQRNKGEMIALMHSELSEVLEAERKNTMDSHLPHRKGAEVELADLLIRLLDYAGGHGYDLEGAFWEKLEYNRNRADHKLENRVKEGGKAF